MAKKKKKARALMPALDLLQWQPVPGEWAAGALDGRGLRGGDGKYAVNVPVSDFGELLLLGGEARFTQLMGSDPTKTHVLPEAPPPTPEAELVFFLDVDSDVVSGRMICASGLEVRARASM